MAYTPKGEMQENNTCPTPEQAIQQFLKYTKQRVPKGFPADPYQGAKWWIAHQSIPDRFAEPATPPTTKGGTWGTPYHDRLVYTLRRFLGMKSVFQVYIIEYIEKGVPWKGEDIGLYRTICEEWEKMGNDKQKYIDEGFKAMHKAVKGMTV